MIECLKLQLKMQLEGLEKLAQFTVQEIGLSVEYSRLLEEGHQTLAKVSLTTEWLQKEVRLFGEESDRSGVLLKQLDEKKIEVQ